MGNKFKEIDTKNCTHHFFDDMVNIKDLDPNKIKRDQNFSYLLNWICDI